MAKFPDVQTGRRGLVVDGESRALFLASRVLIFNVQNRIPSNEGC